MCSAKEIITLQFGQYANMVGTHYWNLQACPFINYKPSTNNILNQEIMFREGKTFNNEIALTPRCIILDPKGQFYLENEETLDKHNKTYNFKMPDNINGNLLEIDKEEDEQMDNLVDSMSYANVIHSNIEAPNINNSQVEENEIKSWRDYFLPPLHIKSIHLVDQYADTNDENKFDYINQGCEVYKKSKDELENQIRYFSEECDYLQGFNILCDTYNAFGGLLYSFYEDIISDEYKNKTSLIYSVRPHFSNKNKYEKQLLSLNSIIAYTQLLNNSAYILPLSISRSLLHESLYQQSLIKYNENIDFESSSILASAIYNSNLPLVNFNHPVSLYNMIFPLNTANKHLLSMSCSLPFNVTNNDWMKSLENCELKSLTNPKCDDNHPWNIPQQINISGFKAPRELDLSISFNEQKIHFIKSFPHIFTDVKYNSKGVLEKGMVTSMFDSAQMSNHVEDLLKGYELMIGRSQHKNMLVKLQIETDDLVQIVEQFKRILFAYNGEQFSDMT